MNKSSYTYRYKLILLLLWGILCASVFSNERIDSLKVMLEEVSGKEKVHVYLEISRYYANNEARIALEYAQGSLNLAQELNYNSGIQKSLHILAISQYQLHDYEEAIKTYSEEVKYIDIEKEPVELSKVYNNLGLIYEIVGDYNNAIEYHRKALDLLDPVHTDKQMLSIAYLNLAIDYKSTGKKDSVMRYIELTNEVIFHPDFDEESLKNLIQVYVSELYYYVGDYDMAFVSINQVLDSNQINDKTSLSTFYLVLGKIYPTVGKYDEAEAFLLKSIELAQEIGQTRREMESRLLLADVYKKMGKPGLALSELEKYTEVMDSTTTAEKNRQILDIEAGYESERKQREIEILKKENALKESEINRARQQNLLFGALAVFAILIFIIIYKAYKFKLNRNKELNDINTVLVNSEQKLNELNSMKDNLIRIIGHDLKGPLGSIIGLSELMLDDEENGSDKAVKFAYQIFKTSQSINHLLDNILHWARLQRGNYKLNKMHFNIREVIVQGISPYRALATNKKINVELDVNERMVAFGDSFACSIVLGNLYNNAIKYSNTGGGIIITAEQDEEKVKITVSDNGVGIEESVQKHLFDGDSFYSTRGTNNETGTGFGLKICRQFIQLNGGTLGLNSEKGKGTSFYFTVPLN